MEEPRSMRFSTSGKTFLQLLRRILIGVIWLNYRGSIRQLRAACFLEPCAVF
jgi:hypothetical protein